MSHRRPLEGSNKGSEQEERAKSTILSLSRPRAASLPTIVSLDKTASLGLRVEWQGEGAENVLLESGSIPAPGRRGTSQGMSPLKGKPDSQEKPSLKEPVRAIGG